MKLKILVLFSLFITISCGQKQQDAKIIISFDEETKNQMHQLSFLASEITEGTSFDTTPYDFANAKIGEVLVYNKFLTANERDMAISLLKSAWGI